MFKLKQTLLEFTSTCCSLRLKAICRPSHWHISPYHTATYEEDIAIISHVVHIYFLSLPAFWSNSPINKLNTSEGTHVYDSRQTVWTCQPCQKSPNPSKNHHSCNRIIAAIHWSMTLPAIRAHAHSPKLSLQWNPMHVYERTHLRSFQRNFC